MTTLADDQNRETLKQAYKSRRWATRVDKMPADQVIAIVLRLKQQGKIKEK